MHHHEFEIEMSVRDYECDMQGVVNNAVYQHYLEHARHEYLKTKGVSFKEYTEKRINLTVVQAELAYKYPLTSGDRFVVTMRLTKDSRVRFAVYQDILLLPERKVALKAKTICVALNPRGRAYVPKEFEELTHE